MARMGMAPRIIGLLVLIFVLLVGGLYFFDMWGLLNARQFFAPVLGLFGQKVEVVNADDPVLLDSIRIRKQEEALDLRYQDFQNQLEAQKKAEAEFNQKLAELSEREKAQADQEKSFKDRVSRYDDVITNLQKNSSVLTSMTPQAAVLILNGYADQDLIDTLRVTQELADAAGTTSLVSVWLSLMDPKRVAEIQRKMAIKPPLDQQP